jgi:hypothetical protein
MTKTRRGFIPRCPAFGPAPSGENQQHCLAQRDGMRFRIVRYKNGRLTAWRVPDRGPIKGRELPNSTRTTRSLDQLLDDAVKFQKRVRYGMNGGS